MGTHTYAILEVSPPTYDEIAAKLHEAGYDHAFNDEGEIDLEIDLHGLALVKSAAGFRPATSGTYPHMCRDGHQQIGHSDSSQELCPLCRTINGLSAARDALEGIRALANVKTNSGVNAKTIFAIKALAEAGLK